VADSRGTLTELAATVRQLHHALLQLQAESQVFGLEGLSSAEWFEIIERKLLPQLGEQAWLVVAVTGGTNIGKSVVFNHLAGFRASSSSPLASGTKHPVCLIPNGFESRVKLTELFPGFRIEPWSTADDSLMSSDDDLLFWRTGAEVPENLLLLDTPDIDSDAPVNWRRADAIRQSADVLVAVLTQQKYNDAAVKQFFRKAAAEDKAVILVFNQCELPDDEEYWPLWCRTFCEETGLSPEWIYVAPNDRKRAESLTLPFFERSGGFQPSMQLESKTGGDLRTGEAAGSGDPRRTKDMREPAAVRADDSSNLSFQKTLSQLRFAEIKLRTLRGALHHVVGEQGVDSYLRKIRTSSADYRSAVELLKTHRLAEVDHWPAPPNPLLVASIREWWGRQRSGWSASVHGFYNTVGQFLMTPVHSVNSWIGGPPEPVWAAYRRLERDAMLRTVEKVYDKLEWLSQLGHDLLKEQLETVLAGTSRGRLLERLAQEHAEVDFDVTMQRLVAAELELFRQENPQYFLFFQRLDIAAAAARPGLSVVLGLSGVGLPLGEAATHFASHAVMQSALHVVGDVAGGTMAAAVGETAISSTAASGIGYLQARFHRLQAAFIAQRVAWLAERLERDLIGDTIRRLEQAVLVPHAPAFQQVEQLTRQIRQSLNSLAQAPDSEKARPDAHG